MPQLERDRYEFRVFSHNLAHVRDRLADVALQVNRDDIMIDQYVASRTTRDVNIKIRQNHLQVKILRARDGCLELWHPVSDTAFPLSGTIARHVDESYLAGAGAVNVPADASLDAQAFVEIVESQPSLAIATVTKRRTRFGYADDIVGEHATVDIAGWGRTETFAVEGSVRRIVGVFITEHGLVKYPNQSYPAFLQTRIFG